MAKPKSRNPATYSSVSGGIPGILPNADDTGFSFSTHNLPASDHFFYATNFQIRQIGQTLHLIFIQRSAFDDSDKARLAIEIAFPKSWAAKFLFDAIWNQPGLNGIGKFIDSVKLESDKSGGLATRGKDNFILPIDPNCYRMFPANFVTCTLSSDQAMLEFFEVTPDTLVTLMYKRPIRPNEGVKSIVSVILSAALLQSLFITLKPLLETASKEEV